MSKFIMRRLIQAIPTMLGISIITYAIMFFAPGNPASQLTLDPNLSQRQREAMLERAGANDSFPEAYSKWLIGDAPWNIAGVEIWGGRQLPVFDRRGKELGTEVGTNKGVLRGDFGRAAVSKAPVTDLMRTRLQPTLELGGFSLLVGTLLGIPIGVLAAVFQGGVFDQTTRIMAVMVSAIPVFWLGLLLLLVFGSWLKWLPMGNREPISISGDISLADRAKHYILPVFTLSSFSIATYSRFMRASVLDVLNQDYIRSAKAKGLADQVVWFRHAMRNALIPVATIFGPSLTLLVSGAVLTETIYSWPGMGTFLVTAIRGNDYNVIMAVVLLSGIFTIMGYLISDILYGLLDPRIRLG